MKRFVFREMLLVSFKERKARRIAFDPKTTIVRGPNETGKSSLLKSLFMAFGADPAKIHPNWQAADARILVRYELDGAQASVLRNGTSYTFFDWQDKVQGNFSSVTKELAPLFSRKFSFGLRLRSRQGAFTTLPPAYYFLPYYMDQDGSWTNAWSGFQKLQQFAKWQKAVIEYHSGIRGNDYYEAQARKIAAEEKRDKLRKKREGLKDIYDSLSTRFEEAQFNVDFSAYKHEVENLLSLCDALRVKQERFKEKLSNLRNHRQSLKTQLDIAMHARDESRADLEHAESLDGDELPCPTCGALYNNDFAQRFEIAVDEDYCANLVVTLNEEIKVIDAKIADEEAAANQLRVEIVDIEKLLARREGEVVLGDLIRQEGRKELRSVMLSDITSLEEEEGAEGLRAKNSEQAMKSMNRPEYRKMVNAYYEEHMRRYLYALDVHGVSDSSISRVDAPIRGTGSELPRALLAYQLAILQVIEKYGTSVRAPIVIDSPNQQDQDPRHLERMLQVIKDEHPKESQLVLGLVDTGKFQFGGTEISLDQKHSLLRSDDFDEVGAEMKMLIDLSLQSAR